MQNMSLTLSLSLLPLSLFLILTSPNATHIDHIPNFSINLLTFSRLGGVLRSISASTLKKLPLATVVRRFSSTPLQFRLGSQGLRVFTTSTMKILVKSAAFQAFASYSEKLCLSVADRMPDFKLKDYFVVSQSMMKMNSFLSNYRTE